MKSKKLIKELEKLDDIPVCKCVDHEYDDDGEISNYFDNRVYRLEDVYEINGIAYVTFSDEKEHVLNQLKKRLKEK